MTRPVAKRELFDIVERLDAFGANNVDIADVLGLADTRVSAIKREIGVGHGRYSWRFAGQGELRFELLRQDCELFELVEDFRCRMTKSIRGRRLT
jgi:hypothetical protein